jgi:hypothetical protein
LRASARLARQETDAALADVLLAVRITDVLEGEPYLSLQGLRWRLLLTSLQPVWEGLAARRWTQPQLAVLHERLERIDLRPDSITALRGERAIYLALVDALIRFKETGELPEKRRPADPKERVLWWLVRRLLPVGWLYQAKAGWYDDFERGLADWAAYTNRVAIARKPRLTVATWNDPFYPVYMAPRVQMVFEDAARDVAWAQTALNEAVTACALERYRLAESRYPNRLEELVPHWLARVPTGLVDGKTLDFGLTGDGAPVLRAAGWGEPESTRASSSADHTDDPLSRLFVRQSEWVWRYPEGIYYLPK